MAALYFFRKTAKTERGKFPFLFSSYLPLDIVTQVFDRTNKKKGHKNEASALNTDVSNVVRLLIRSHSEENSAQKEHYAYDK